MADTVETLKELARQVRYATQEGENTGERVGRTLVGILNLLSQCSLEELNKIFLHKSKPDETPFLLKLLGGAEVGETIDSLVAGKGILLKNGRVQADTLEARFALIVQEVIFNRLSAMESDYFFPSQARLRASNYWKTVPTVYHFVNAGRMISQTWTKMMSFMV